MLERYRVEEKEMIGFKMMKGYEGKYWFSQSGEVRNFMGKTLKPIILSGGVKAVDLYGDGLRERHLISVLLQDNFPELYKEEENDRKDKK